jgi:IPT/TIG domain/Glucose / Sorbosone dehydrogenase
VDTKAIPDVYFNAQTFFHRGNMSTSGTGINGRIMRASGPALDTIVTVISGLPVSDLDHGMNHMMFGDNGELYWNHGRYGFFDVRFLYFFYALNSLSHISMVLYSNTNGGLPGKLSSSRQLKENFLSAAMNVAYMSHPDFNGTVAWSAPDDGNMIASGIDVYGTGLRNPFGLVYHSNGKVYSTDNGPNFSYGRMMTGCGEGQAIVGQTTWDKFIYVEPGKYYGHPHPKRAAFFNDSRQCVWRSPMIATSANYQRPMLYAPSSQVGMIEYTGNQFGGQLRGNLMTVHYQATKDTTRLILSDDGTTISPLAPYLIELGFGTKALDHTQAPNGNLVELRYAINELHYVRPVEAVTTQLVVNTVFPVRGPNAGGHTISLYGENFDTNGPTVTVMIGNVECLNVTIISSQHVDCTVQGGTGHNDVVVSNGAASSKIPNGYRYVTGLPPPGFVLPVYTGV